MIKHFSRRVDYKIPGKLKGLVLAVIHGESKEKVDLLIPIFATGYPLIVNTYADKPSYTIDSIPYKTESRLIVAGQIFNARIVFKQQGFFGNVGIVLSPTAPYYLFHKAGVAFNNMWTCFEEASPLGSTELSKGLSCSTSPKERVKTILSFLEQLEKHRLPVIPWLEKTLSAIFRHNGKVGQEELITLAEVSPRHFRRIFKNVVGIPPKYFCKVIQLNTVFELLNNSGTEKLHHLALDCGYYDQAHFIHDFQKLIGESPEKFLKSNHAYIKNYMGRLEC